VSRVSRPTRIIGHFEICNKEIECKLLRGIRGQSRVGTDRIGKNTHSESSGPYTPSQHRIAWRLQLPKLDKMKKNTRSARTCKISSFSTRALALGTYFKWSRYVWTTGGRFGSGAKKSAATKTRTNEIRLPIHCALFFYRKLWSTDDHTPTLMTVLDRLSFTHSDSAEGRGGGGAARDQTESRAHCSPRPSDLNFYWFYKVYSRHIAVYAVHSSVFAIYCSTMHSI